MSNEPSPWSQPDPRWQPQSYRDTQGRDPRQPFGAPQQPEGHQPPSIQDFRAPSGPKTPWWMIAAGVVAAIALVLVALQFVGGEPEVTPSPTPSVQVSGEEIPGSSATGGNAIPFEGNGTGLFELLNETWDDQGVLIEYRVTLDQGRESFGFYLFNNETMAVADPMDLTPVVVSAGEPYSGTVRFDVVRATGTLVLTSAYGRALTALPIKG